MQVQGLETVVGYLCSLSERQGFKYGLCDLRDEVWAPYFWNGNGQSDSEIRPEEVHNIVIFNEREVRVSANLEICPVEERAVD